VGVDGDVADLAACTVRALGHSLDRRDELQTEALASAVADRKREIAKALDTALTNHLKWLNLD
jgi:hypothetical protein